MEIDDLSARLRAGDATARRQLFECHAERVWSLAFRVTDDWDLAHDVVQETFLHAFRKIGGYDGRGTLRGWLCRIALNRARDLVRTRRRRATIVRRIDRADDAPVVAPVADALLAERVWREVDGLPEHHRIVLVMHDVEGYTHEEIAQALGIAVGSSRARLSRARAILRGALGQLARENRE